MSASPITGPKTCRSGAGFNHFDRIKIDFYRDRQPEFEAFKKGDIFWRMESTAKTWATEYNFPAIQQKRVIKRDFSGEKRPQLQAWAVNQRREHFRDPRVREAISLCFDFEWTQKNLFYGMYERSQSLFEQSDFRATGKPSPEELALMEPFRDRLPEAIFDEALMQAPSDGSGRDRKNLRRAVELLTEAGFKRDGNRFVDAARQTAQSRNAHPGRGFRARLFALHQQPPGDRHQCLIAACRSCAISAQAAGFRFRHYGHGRPSQCHPDARIA